MEIAVDKIEALIKEAEVSLNNIVFQVEMKLLDKTGVQLKFADILPVSEELKQELEEIKEEAEVLRKAQKELKCNIDKDLDVVCKKIMDLQSKSGCKTEQSKAAATVLKSRMANLEVK